jgi:hypothetical protein
MINASAQNTPIVFSCDFVLDLAPIVVWNLSNIAVAIHNLGNLAFQVFPCSLVHLYLLFLLLFFFFFFSNFSFPMLKAMALEAAASLFLFADTAKVFVFNGVCLIVGMVSLPFCCSRELSLALV